MNRYSPKARRLAPAWMLLATVFILTGNLRSQSSASYPFQNPDLAVEDRIDNVLSLLTLQEKVALLGRTLNVPRLGIRGSAALPSIPGSNAQFEGLHGLAVGGPGNWAKKSPGGAGKYGGISSIPTTQYPQAIGLGQTWDPALLQEIAAEEGGEARYIFQSFDRGGLIVRSPNADLVRDPRWGRTEESYGEDPYLVGTMAVAFTRGLQGGDPHYWLTASLAKHFMANSNEDNRRGSSSNFDDRLLNEYYSAPFRMVIEQGKSNALMAAYNAVNTVPMTSSPFLKSLVQKQWGFDGILDTDRGALKNLVTAHHAYPNMEEAAAAAIHAGINQFLDEYDDPVKTALEKKLITERDLDENLRGVFRVLIRLGLLDPSGRVGYTNIKADYSPAPWEKETSKALALKATQESIVLLKNKGNLLPLEKTKLRSIAIVGPLGDQVDSDGYGGTPPFAITPLDGIREKAGEKVVVRFERDPQAAVELARASDVAIVMVGNRPTCNAAFGRCSDQTEGKEGIDRKAITLSLEQERLVQDVVAANPRTIMVLTASFPYAIVWAEDYVPAIVSMTHSSEMQGAALADVLFGDYNPGGRLTTTWPRSLDQLPPMMDYDIRHGRTYMYVKGQPLYPFGYGLSYTHFRYRRLRVSSHELASTNPIAISAEVTNDGGRTGDEVVQLYVKHIGSKIQRPKEELKGFKRITLEAGATKTVEFHLSASDMGYWEEQSGQWRTERDRVRILVGTSSSDLRAGVTVNVRP